MSSQQKLPGGRDAGASRRGDVVVRAAGAWTPAVHHLLAHLADRGFDQAPPALGYDANADLVSFLPGETVGERRPWPVWVHTDEALAQVARWLGRYHRAVADYQPPAEAVWREARELSGPDVIIAHNDAAPYNAVWRPDRRDGDQLVGFVDWDMAGPRRRLDDLAWTAFGWVPLHARQVVAAEGFSEFGRRRERVRLFLDAYADAHDQTGAAEVDHGRIEVVELVSRLRLVLDDHVELVRRRAAGGDPTYQTLIELGRLDDLRTARDELDDL